jgi:hypothetical protein
MNPKLGERVPLCESIQQRLDYHIMVSGKKPFKDRNGTLRTYQPVERRRYMTRKPARCLQSRAQLIASSQRYYLKTCELCHYRKLGLVGIYGKIKN